MTFLLRKTTACLILAIFAIAAPMAASASSSKPAQTKFNRQYEFKNRVEHRLSNNEDYQRAVKMKNRVQRGERTRGNRRDRERQRDLAQSSDDRTQGEHRLSTAEHRRTMRNQGGRRDPGQQRGGNAASSGMNE